MPFRTRPIATTVALSALAIALLLLLPARGGWVGWLWVALMWLGAAWAGYARWEAHRRLWPSAWAGGEVGLANGGLLVGGMLLSGRHGAMPWPEPLYVGTVVLWRRWRSGSGSGSWAGCTRARASASSGSTLCPQDLTHLRPNRCLLLTKRPALLEAFA
jgi:hypothetical protein